MLSIYSFFLSLSVSLSLEAFSGVNQKPGVKAEHSEANEAFLDALLHTKPRSRESRA